MGENEETVNRVRVEYVAEDHASAVAKKIAEAYREPAEAVNRLKERFSDLRRESLLMATGALGVGFGLGSLIDKAKEANREFHGTQKAIASTLDTVLAWPRALDPVERFQRSMRLATSTTQELDDKSADLGTSLGDMSSAYRTLAQAVAPMHLSQQQLIDLTEKSTALAVRFGESATGVADQVGHALVTKTVRPIGDVGIYLTEHLGRRLQALNSNQILNKFDQAMAGSVETAKLMSEGVGGSITRIQRRIDDVFLHVSGPVFKEVAKEVEHFYQKLKQTTDEGRPLMDVYGQKLVAVFHDLRDAAGFIADHWKSIALIWASAKVPKIVETGASLLGGLKGGENPLSQILELRKLFSGGAGVAGGLGAGNVLSILGTAATGLTGVATASILAAQALHGVYEEWQSRKRQAADLGGFFKDVGEIARTNRYIAKHASELSAAQMEDAKASVQAHAMAAAEGLKQRGLLDNGVISMEKFNGVMDSMSDDVRKSFMGMLPGSPDASSGLLGAYAAEVFRKAYQAPSATAAPPDDTGRKTTGKTFNFFGPVNINQKFEDQDPDRVAVRLKDDLENYTNRRTQSALSGVGGF